MDPLQILLEVAYKQTELRKEISCRPVYRFGETIFIPLPRELWRSAGPCACDECKGKEAYWDTMALAASDGTGWKYEWTNTVHFPHRAVCAELSKKYQQERRKK